MRIPKVYKSQLEDSEVQIQNIKLHIDKLPFYCQFNFQDDEKQMVKLINYIERIVRGSYEYKNFIAFLKEKIDMNNCSFFNKLTRDDISIEIHHSPLTLFEIVSIVISKHINEYGADNINEYDIAEEVVRLHYEGYIGLIPLSLTVHELVHAGKIFIPINCVNGRIKDFYKEYKDYFTEDQKSLLKNHIATTKQIDNQNYRPSSLDRKFTYVEVDGLSFPKKLENKIETEVS